MKKEEMRYLIAQNLFFQKGYDATRIQNIIDELDIAGYPIILHCLNHYPTVVMLIMACGIYIVSRVKLKE